MATKKTPTKRPTHAAEELEKKLRALLAKSDVITYGKEKYVLLRKEYDRNLGKTKGGFFFSGANKSNEVRGVIPYLIGTMDKYKTHISGYIYKTIPSRWGGTYVDKEYVGTVKYNPDYFTSTVKSKIPEEKEAKRAQDRRGVKIAKKLLAEGKLPEGHIKRLGARRQTLPKAKSRADDLARNAMLAGYRVSKNGNIYYEARANRSDTPKERNEYSIVTKRTKKATRTTRSVGKSRQPDRYQPPRYAKMRQPRYRIKPIITPLGEEMKDNYLTKIAVGHWYDGGKEYQILQAKDGADKGKWFLWSRLLPNPTTQLICDSEWRLLYPNPMGDTFERAIKAVETQKDVRFVMYPERGGCLPMTEGLYNYIDRRHQKRYDDTINDAKVVPIIMKYERKIHDLPPSRHENILCFDNLGNVLFHGVGSATSCSEPVYVRKVMFYMTHNHPYDHKTPCGFSEGDLKHNSEDSSIYSPINLHMIRACGYGRYWSLIKPFTCPRGYSSGINNVFSEMRGKTDRERFTAVNEWLEKVLTEKFGDKFKAGNL